jgi:hypothetical protein
MFGRRYEDDNWKRNRLRVGDVGCVSSESEDQYQHPTTRISNPCQVSIGPVLQGDLNRLGAKSIPVDIVYDQ